MTALYVSTLENADPRDSFQNCSKAQVSATQIPCFLLMAQCYFSCSETTIFDKESSGTLVDAAVKLQYSAMIFSTVMTVPQPYFVHKSR